MANPKHVEILNQGVEVWNEWRKNNLPLPNPLPNSEMDWYIWRSANQMSLPDFRDSVLKYKNLNNAHLEGGELMNANFVGAFFEGAQLQGADFRNCNLEVAHLNGANLEGADLAGANFNRAYLLGAFLNDANLDGANLEGASLTLGRLERAKLRNAHLNGIELQGADLVDADLDGAHLQGSNLNGAYLFRANLSNANLEGACLVKAHVQGANFRNANLECANVTGIDYNIKKKSIKKYFSFKIDETKFLGCRVSTSYGSARFRRDAQDQDFLEELRLTKKGNIIYWIWLITCDCGRSFSRWSSWCAGFIILFAFIYLFFPSEGAFKHVGHLWDIWTCLYYSIVTFTTLGYGDISPLWDWAKFFVALEVVIGYVALGGLISILGNKVARRS